MSLIDSHIHLDFPAFDVDREAVVARANAVGVAGFVLPSVSEARWSAVLETVASVPNSVAAYGLHPCYLDAHSDGVLNRLDQWLDLHSAVAVGECGLDFHLNPPETEGQQLMLFDGQISIAVQRKLPLIIHARKAVDRVTQRLRVGGANRGVVHSFSGSWQQACNLVDLGFHIGVGGAVTHARAQKLRRIVAKLPDDAWVLETDAPDQPGAGHQGQRNEPAYLTEVVDVVAEVRGMSKTAVCELATANTQQLFNISFA